MRMEWFLCLAGQEVSNHARVANYINNVGLPVALYDVPVDCACSALDTGFSLPTTDPAPWYEITRPDSADFFGFMAASVNVSPVASRSVQENGRWGSFLGPYRAAGRAVQVSGLMWARSAEGMAYGERWLTEVLRGSPCSNWDCPEDDIVILPACPESEGYDSAPYFRTLVNGGLVDGPQFSAFSQSSPECIVQQASFVLVSSQPYLYHPPTRCWNQQSLATPLACALTTPTWMGEGTFRIEIENTDSTPTTDITISGKISLDGSCPVTGAGTSVPYSWVYEIPSLAAEDKIVIDGARRQVLYYDASEKYSKSGLPYITFEGPWKWPDVGPCTTMCLSVSASGGSATATVDSFLREL